MSLERRPLTPVARIVVAFAGAMLFVSGLGCDPRGMRRRPPRQEDPFTVKQTLADRLELDSRRAAAARDKALSTALDHSDESGERVFAKARFTWIRKSPNPDAEWIGYLTLGESVAIRAGVRESAGGTSCERWVPVVPRGWVCVGRDATLDANDETFKILEERVANRASPWPFEYARSLGAARYRGLPTLAEQKAKEGNIDKLREKVEKARSLTEPAAIKAIDPRLVDATLGLTHNPAPPRFEPPFSVMESDENLELGSTIAYSYEFDHDDRAWLLSWDHAVIPAVRTTKYPRSAFHGVELDDEVDLPLAFSKKHGAKRYIDMDGRLVPTMTPFEGQSLVELEPGTREQDGETYLPTEETGVYVAAKDVVIVAPLGVPPQLPEDGRRTWVEVSTVGGWLVAYEGARPVFATLISAGRAAMKPDGTMVPSSSTPTGTYTVHSKLVTTTMRSENRPNAIHAEVMYTQVFFDDYALHGAYWHDDWGNRRSAGCVNLSPMDSKWLFEWSEPRVPTNWHAKKVEGGEPATVVVIHF
ncbi:MAG: L,D-transpeptidase [Polyangiaceae bacterium]